MTKEDKIQFIITQIDKSVTTDWISGFEQGLSLMYDARELDFKKRKCSNCKFYSHMQGCMGGIMIYDEEMEDYVKITGDFSCNKWEEK